MNFFTQALQFSLHPFLVLSKLNYKENYSIIRSLAHTCTIFIGILLFSESSVYAQTWLDVGGSNGVSLEGARGSQLKIDANGVPYVAYNRGSSIRVKKLNSGAWANVGGTLSASTEPLSLAIASNGVPYVANANFVRRLATNNTSWVGASGSGNGSVTIAQDGIGAMAFTSTGPVILFADQNPNYNGELRASVARFNGTGWSYFGQPSFSDGVVEATRMSIAVDANNRIYVSYLDFYSGSTYIRLYDQDNDSWNVLGNPIECDRPTSLAIDPTTTTPYVAFTNYNGDILVKKFDVDISDWADVGTSLGNSGSSDSKPSLAFSSTGVPYLVFIDPSNGNKATVVQFNGTDWVPLGTAGISPAAIRNCSIAIDNLNKVYISYELESNGYNYVKSFDLNYNANLSNLTINPGVFNPPFDGSLSLSQTVEFEVSSVKLTPTAVNAAATIEMNVNGGGYSNITSGNETSPINLNVGLNTINIRITFGSISKVYSISITRRGNIRLSSLSINTGALTPTFQTDTLTYWASPVNNNVQFVNITAVKQDANAILEYRANSIVYSPLQSGSASANIPLNEGNNRIDIRLSEVNGFTRVYTINVERVANLNTQGAIATYSLRKVISGYVGDAIQVRRSTDNATQGIGFTANGDLDTTALKTFAGSGDAFVTIWYDQSGNGRNTIQNSTSNQPQIVVNGNVYRQNGKPSIYFDGFNYYLQTGSAATWLNNTAYTVNAVLSQAQLSHSSRRIFLSTVGTTTSTGLHVGIEQNRDLLFNHYNDDARFETLASQSTSLSINTYIKRSTTGSYAFLNSSRSLSSNNPQNFLNTTGGMRIGTSFDLLGDWHGYISEIFITNNDINANGTRGLLENNQSSYYNVYNVNSNATTLLDLTTNAAALVPAFSTNTFSYTATVPFTTGSIVVTPSIPTGTPPTSYDILISINGGSSSSVSQGASSNPLSLNVGNNVINIILRTTSGTVQSNYIITVTRLGNNNADLSSLSISQASLATLFTKNNTTYNASVGATVNSVTVTPTLDDTRASVQVRINNGSYSTVTSGSPSAPLSLNLSSNTIDVRVTAADLTTVKTYSIIVNKTMPKIVWTGATNTDWNTASNWSTNTVPTISDSVEIPLVTNQPSVTGTVSIQTLTVATGAIINNSGTLNVSSELINNGTILGTLQLSGTTNQAISGTGSIANLTLNNSAGATIGSGKTTITNQYIPTAGTLTTNGNLVLASTSTGTARIAAGTGSYISGNVTVQRYIPAKSTRRFSFISSPVGQSLSAAWQQQIHITGAGTGGTACPTLTAHSNGFDATAFNSPSIFSYNASLASGSRWQANTTGTTAFNLVPGDGYRLLVRGARSIGCSLLDGSTVAPTAVTLSATGAMTSGVNMGTVTKTYNNNVSNNWVLIGNPYPSELNFSDFRTTNAAAIGASYIIYDPQNAPDATVPANMYSTWNAGTWSNAPTSINNANGQYIASGQAFFVQATNATNVSLTFNESHKYNGSQNGVFRVQNWNDIVRVGLNKDHIKIDQTVIRFSNNSSVQNETLGLFDATLFSSANAFLASQKAGKNVSIQTRVLQQNTEDEVWLNFDVATSGNYTLNFSEFEKSSIENIHLVDVYTQTKQNIKENASYSFEVDKNKPQSFGASRFKLTFKRSSNFIPSISRIKLFPNPTSNSLTLELPNSQADAVYTIKIVDMNGRVQVVKTIASGVQQLGLGNLAAGKYVVEIVDGKGNKSIEHLIKK